MEVYITHILRTPAAPDPINIPPKKNSLGLLLFEISLTNNQAAIRNSVKYIFVLLIELPPVIHIFVEGLKDYFFFFFLLCHIF